MKTVGDKLLIGCLENCSLPELGIDNLQVRVDTGAKTSSLHVDNLQRYSKDGKSWVRFDLHPNIHKVNDMVECCSPIKDIRRIKSSNGTAEERYIISTLFQLGADSWPIEISLTDRSDMSYLMLFGREGMKNKVIVDPSATFLVESY